VLLPDRRADLPLVQYGEGLQSMSQSKGFAASQAGAAASQGALTLNAYVPTASGSAPSPNPLSFTW
jgi:hypothetical protein